MSNRRLFGDPAVKRRILSVAGLRSRRAVERPVSNAQCRTPGQGAPAARVLRMFRAILQSSRSEEHTSELQSLMRISYAVFCLNNTTQAQSHNPATTPHK